MTKKQWKQYTKDLERESEELCKQLEQQKNINNIAVGNNYALNEEVNRTEKHMRICEKENEKLHTIIGYLESKIVEMVGDD